MPNVRAAGKQMLGAQVSEELSAAVDEWQRKFFPKTRTHFIVEASLEKLAQDGIVVDKVAVLRDGRSRIKHPVAVPVSYSAPVEKALGGAPAAKREAAKLAKDEDKRRKP